MNTRRDSSCVGTIWCLVALPPLRIVTLAIVQIVGFVLGAQFAGVSTQPASTVKVETSTQHSSESTNKQEQSIQTVAADDSREETASQIRQARMFGLLVLACLLNSAVMVFWIQQTTLTGVALVAGSFAVFLSCMTIMPQSDVFLYLRNSSSMIRTSAIMGICVSGLFATSTVPVFWRWRKRPSEQQNGPASNLLRGISTTGFLWRLCISALVYVSVYLLFGYFVAWMNPELRSVYGGDAGKVMGFWERMITPPLPNRVIPFQILRGFLWTLLCVGMIRFSTGGRWSLAIAVGLVLAVVMNSQLLLPNPFMSQGIRMTHMIETAASNFLFGFFCVRLWTFHIPHPRARHRSEFAASGRSPD